MLSRFLALGSVLFVLSSCADPEPMFPPDPHSFARPAEARVEHIHLDLNADFDRKVLEGSARLDIATAPDAKEIHVDIRDITIREITLLPSGEPGHFSLSQPKPHLGSDLAIGLKPGTKSVLIEYETSPTAAALQWLAPQQTAGKQHPFLFTQSQAILARTWVPCQDGPGVRFTYSARIKVPQGLLALMSASNPTEVSADGVYEFEMRQPIPSYLLALAIGDIAFRAVGPRTGVYAEPSVVEAAAKEFEDTEAMVVAAERLYGPYRWERYDIIVLPPSFPFGGMENPRLTFATPTVIAGDKSLVSLVAHELAHSWSGNLVTNATWNDFWLNEGFTTYFENRIMEEVSGESYARMLFSLALQDLRKTVDELGAQSPDTQLKLDLAGRDPDDGMNDIAYNKGAMFLRHCEETVGRERWDAFLRKYFDANAFRPMTTEAFEQYLREHLVRGDDDLEKELAIGEWLYRPGLPSTLPEVQSDEFAKVERVIASWTAGEKLPDARSLDWTTHHWLHFLRNLPAALTPDQMSTLDKAYAFTASGNSEVLAAWLERAVAASYAPADKALERFLTSQGRRKFLRPLYAALAKTPAGLERARVIYASARPGYHAVSYQTIDGILSITP